MSSSPASSRANVEWVPWLLVIAGVAVVVGLGAFMSRVRGGPTLRGEFDPAEVQAIVESLRAAHGRSARCDELKRQSADEVLALVTRQPGSDAAYDIVTLRRVGDDWRIVETRPWR